MQLELLLNKPRDATPAEVDSWRQTDYFSKGDFDPLILFVVVPTLIQIGAVGAMAIVMLANANLF
jgi:hypothetical protein